MMMSRARADGVFGVFRRDKINELYDWMRQLESEKFDHMERLKRQKYEVRPLPLHLLQHIAELS